MPCRTRDSLPAGCPSGGHDSECVPGSEPSSGAEESSSNPQSRVQGGTPPSSPDVVTSSDSEFEDSVESHDEEIDGEIDISDEADSDNEGRALVWQPSPAKPFIAASCSSPIAPAEERKAEAVGKLSLFFYKETFVDSSSSSTLLV